MMTRSASILAFALAAVGLLAPESAAQPPGSQYPGGQYPGGQYPGGQYPPNGPYPQDNRYPARLPGGVPINLPVPEIKLPRRKPKAEPTPPGTAKAPRVSLSSIEGTLRSFGAKDLVLEASKARLLRFRLLAKTQFVDKADRPVRDSLLRPGDKLSLHVNTDDPETALRVILQRTGTAAERAAAGKPVDEAKIAEPEIADITPLKTAPAGEEPAPEVAANPPTPTAPVDDARPPIRRTPEGIPQSPAPAIPGTFAGAVDPIIEAARQAADSFTSEMPNFVVNQVTTRYQSGTTPPDWRALDVVTAEVTSQNGTEEYKNVKVNGRPLNRPIEESGGAWSTGEFVTTLQDVLSPSTAADFKKRAESRVANRPAYCYDFSVQQQNSHWKIIAPDHSSFMPAYTGSLWIDKETKRVLRIEMKARVFPQSFTWNRVDSNLEYGYVMIDGRNFLLPTESDNTGCAAGTNTCSRNVLSFRNYRKFGADTKIIFDKLIARQQPGAIEP